MKHAVYEFSRPLQVDRVPKLGSHERLTADSKECAALAARVGIPKIHSFGGFLHVTPWRGGGLKIAGNLEAEVDQISVVSLETFTEKVNFPVERFFLPQRESQSTNEEDVDVIENGSVDLGEVLAETLALELDPYPRQPGEVFNDLIESVEPEKVSPFTKLKRP
jgi:Large ribosomal RNA subunit accumulation protein YceD